MAFGKTSGGRNYGPNAKLFYFRLKTKDLPEPKFEVSVKKAGAEGGKDAYETVDDNARFVEGNLIEISNKEFKHDKKTIKSVSVTLQDTSEGKNEVYFVTIPHTYLGRNILNSLIALKSFEGVQIAVYKGKPRPDKNDPSKMIEGFHSSAVRQNGELVYGKFKNEELPKIPKVKVGEQLFSDDTEITSFFIAQVNELAKALKDAAPKASTSTVAGSEAAEERHDGNGEPPLDGEPF